MVDRLVTTKTELLAEIKSEYKSLKQVLDRLSEVQMTSIRDSKGWTVKDYIAHLTSWERLVLFFFRGRPPHLALQVDQTLYLRGSNDEINELIRGQSHDAPPDEVVANFESVHQELMRLLEAMENEALQKPYRHYLPEETGGWKNNPAINVAYGNTAYHYKEQHEWIESLIREAP